MFEQVNIRGLFKSTSLTIFFSFLSFVLLSQTLLFKGIVKDEQTLKPIPDINIKVFGTTQGTATDSTGRFSLRLDKIPAILIFSSVGYENEFIKSRKFPKLLLNFF